VDELKTRASILIVTHNMQQAARCSDFTAFMYLGELVEFGSTEQIFFKPSKKQTEDYITGASGRRPRRSCNGQWRTHIKQYDQELESLRGRILQMGGLVESQAAHAIDCFPSRRICARRSGGRGPMSGSIAEEVEVARIILNLIVRRQPAANDLRADHGRVARASPTWSASTTKRPDARADAGFITKMWWCARPHPRHPGVGRGGTAE